MREFLSDWDSDEQNYIVRRRDQKILQGGKLNEWHGKPSGNFLGGMFLTRQERGLCGPLVLQLV